MYNDTVTLFNRYRKEDGDLWYPAILRNVNFNMERAALVAKYGADTQDNAILNISYVLEEFGEGEPQCRLVPWLKGRKLVAAGEIWLPPHEWDALAGTLEDGRPPAVTFRAGNNFDFIWFGEWDGEDAIPDSEYQTGGFYEHMRCTQDYVFAVTSVGGPYTVIPHFEIMGR